MGASQVPKGMMALVVPQGHLAGLVPKALKDFRVRRYISSSVTPDP